MDWRGLGYPPDWRMFWSKPFLHCRCRHHADNYPPIADGYSLWSWRQAQDTVCPKGHQKLPTLLLGVDKERSTRWTPHDQVLQVQQPALTSERGRCRRSTTDNSNVCGVESVTSRRVGRLTFNYPGGVYRPSTRCQDVILSGKFHFHRLLLLIFTN